MHTSIAQTSLKEKSGAALCQGAGRARKGHALHGALGGEGTLGGSASQTLRPRASPLEIPFLGRVRGPRMGQGLTTGEAPIALHPQRRNPGEKPLAPGRPQAASRRLPGIPAPPPFMIHSGFLCPRGYGQRYDFSKIVQRAVPPRDPARRQGRAENVGKRFRKTPAQAFLRAFFSRPSSRSAPFRGRRAIHAFPQFWAR